MSLRRREWAAAVLGVLLLVSCRQSTGQKILADETLFPKGLAKMAEDYRAGCAGQQKAAERTAAQLNPGAKVAGVTISATADLPEPYRPALSDIEKKYGKAERMEEGVHYYGDIGLRPQEGKVVAVVIRCGSKP
jgi:hypothetical protein